MRGLIAARTAVMSAVAAIVADMRRMTRASAACRRLMTIPGVGQLTALAFIAAIDDQAPGREPQGLCRAPTRRALSLLILDARYEKVREGGVVASQAVLIAIGVDWDGRRQILAVEMANRESRSSWKDFLLGLRQRGLHGVEFVVADDHAGLRSAIREVLAEAAFQRCYVHFCATPSTICRARPTMILRCAGCTTGARPRRPAAIFPPGSPNGAPATKSWNAWVEETIEETLTFYRLPRQTISISRAPTYSNVSTKRSGGEPTSCASSQTQTHAAASSERWLSRPTKTGSRRTDIST